MVDYEHLFIKHADFSLLSGDKALSEYTFGTGSAKHWFCSRCGVKSFYQPRSHPEAYSINLKCVDNPPLAANLIDFDGKNSLS